MKLPFFKNLLVLVTISCFCSLKAQTISGWVVDCYKLPVRDASVVIDGTIDTTKTDVNGYFFLKGISNNAVLKISKYRYKDIEIKIEEEKRISVRLGKVGGCWRAYPGQVIKPKGGQNGDKDGSIVDLPSVYSNLISEFKPWPPPNPSAKVVLPKEVFTNCKNLGNVNDILIEALNKNGYDDKSYFSVPSTNNKSSGFALVTRLEQIDKNGVPKKDPNRWNTNNLQNDFSFTEYVKALFFSNPGYFRVIVFVVTDIGFNTPGSSPDRDTALAWLAKGNNALPYQIKQFHFGIEYDVTALIYEYELPENTNNAHLVNNISGIEHLKKANLWNSLTQNK